MYNYNQCYHKQLATRIAPSSVFSYLYSVSAVLATLQLLSHLLLSAIDSVEFNHVLCLLLLASSWLLLTCSSTLQVLQSSHRTMSAISTNCAEQHHQRASPEALWRVRPSYQEYSCSLPSFHFLLFGKSRSHAISAHY